LRLPGQMDDQAGRVLTPQGNLLNKHSHKYSGLANSKVINIYANAEGGVSITKVKADAKPNQVASARSHVSLKRTTGPRRANKIAAAETAGKGYRSDLRKVSRTGTSCDSPLPSFVLASGCEVENASLVVVAGSADGTSLSTSPQPTLRTIVPLVSCRSRARCSGPSPTKPLACLPLPFPEPSEPFLFQT